MADTEALTKKCPVKIRNQAVYCSNCDYHLADDTVTCPECGMRIDSEMIYDAKVINSARTRFIIHALCLFLSILVWRTIIVRSLVVSPINVIYLWSIYFGGLVLLFVSAVDLWGHSRPVPRKNLNSVREEPGGCFSAIVQVFIGLLVLLLIVGLIVVAW